MDLLYKRSIWVVSLCVALSVSVGGQEPSQGAEQSELSKILKASGKLYVRTAYDLPHIPTTSGAPIEFQVVVVNILVGEGEPRKPIVGVRLSIEGEYSKRTAILDAAEAEGLLASLRTISSEGMAILTTSLIDGLDGDTEIYYTKKEEVSLAAFEVRGAFRYGMRIGDHADWAVLATVNVDAVSVLKSNLSQAIEVAALITARDT